MSNGFNFKKKDKSLKQKVLSEIWKRNIRKIFRELIAFKFCLANKEIKDTKERLFHSIPNPKGDGLKLINFREEACIVLYYFVYNRITKEKFE